MRKALVIGIAGRDGSRLSAPAGQGRFPRRFPPAVAREEHGKGLARAAPERVPR
jgi:hypothetical protein